VRGRRVSKGAAQCEEKGGGAGGGGQRVKQIK